MTPLKNPFKGANETIRLNVDAPIEVVQLLRSVLFDMGSVSRLLAIHLNHIYEYAKRNDFTFTDRDKLLSYIERLSEGVPNGNTTSGHERRTASRVRQNVQGTSNVPTVGGRKPSTKTEVGDDNQKATDVE